MNEFWDGFEVISVYTARDAMADGILFDITDIFTRSTGVRPINHNLRITVGVVDFCKEIAGSEEKWLQVLPEILNAYLEEVRDSGVNTDAVLIFGYKQAEFWACPDFTSGNAVHIIRPEEY